ncbi:SgcJ/EcaC family oxidoreductase [Emticicia sp. C21]|uniref:SgcJ/EcaC family oxidoreductase n=1 Tax=Emticicia sp. C21 TaxID=2302915 RepID=UPI000E340A4F|nr:SgcJ/EcaC family oxidoreductase [Emticicia sp. C21]RFS17056.1 SgcJ/EcaC family oxidoreductase [Emticicia sp. C21]
MKIMLVFLGMVLSFDVFSQSKTADEMAVEKQVDAMIASWNNHDYSDIANYTTEDASWVNIVGMWWKNRKEVKFAHQAYHERMFKTVRLTKNWIETRKIAPDVMIAHVNTHVGAFQTPAGDLKPEADNLLLAVFVKKGGKWLLTAAENVEIVADAKANDPVKFMPK